MLPVLALLLGALSPFAAAPAAGTLVPTDLTISSGDAKLDISWTAPSSNQVQVTGYVVHYTATPSQPSTWTAVARGTETSPPTASQAITGLTNGTLYWVRVRAKYSSGASAWVNITGTPGAATLGFSGHAELTLEGQAEILDLLLSEALPVDTTVRIKVDASDATCPVPTGETRAEEDTDFSLPTTTVRFPAGTTERTLTVNVVADRTSEGVEVFCLVVEAPEGAPYVVRENRRASTYTQVAVAILDRSTSIPLLVSTLGKTTEGELKTGFEVSLLLASAAPAGGTQVTLSIGSASTAAETTDFTLSPKTVTIREGEHVGKATLTIVDDAVDDDGETIVLNASSTNPAHTATAHTVTIVDNNLPELPLWMVRADDITVAPREGRLEVRWKKLTQAGAPAHGAVVRWRRTTPQGVWWGVNLAADRYSYHIESQYLEGGQEYEVQVGYRRCSPRDPVAEPGGYVTCEPNNERVKFRPGPTDPMITATTAILPPGVPRNLRIVAGNDQVTVHWDPPASWGTWEPGGYQFVGYAAQDPRIWVRFLEVTLTDSGPEIMEPHTCSKNGERLSCEIKKTLIGNFSNFAANGVRTRVRIWAWSKKPGTDGLEPGTNLYGPQSPEVAATPTARPDPPSGPYAALIALVHSWRDDPRHSWNMAHVERWDRVLLALGETVSTPGLTAMTAAEAQGHVNRGWTRWVQIAAALKQIESDTRLINAPAILTKRSVAREGTDDAVEFSVHLSRAAAGEVTVDYATANGSGAWAGTAPAAAGADYTATSGTLTFAAGETAKTVSVPIIDDAIDEGTEYFVLRFSNPQGATLSATHRERRGLIRNSDPLQAMWLARFGRMVGSQVTDAVSERLGSGLSPGAHATLAGQRLDLAKADDARALGDAMAGFARAFGAEEASAVDDDPFARRGRPGLWNHPAAAAPRSMTGRELLLGSSFHLATDGAASGPGVAAWGRVAHGRFDGVHADDTGRTSVDGEVLTGVLGADADFGRVLAGVAVSLSEGDGKFDAPHADTGKAGKLESTMTTLSPYARIRLTERVSAWGLAGLGTGDMAISFDDGAMDTIRTDVGLRLGALGARGALLEQDEWGGMDLALKADAFFVRLKSEKAANSVETKVDASRLRLVLEGARRFAVSETATLRPSLELGLRHDGGDAETGAGFEVGGAVAFTDEASGLSLEAKARVLAAHADSDYEEWGLSATARLDPGERGRGLSLSLAPTLGASSSASQRLWGAERPRDLTPGAEFEASRGLQAEAGYGLALFGGRFTGTPNFGLRLADGGARDWRLGWRLTSALGGDSPFELNVDATRREAAGDREAEHGVVLRGAVRW